MRATLLAQGAGQPSAALCWPPRNPLCNLPIQLRRRLPGSQQQPRSRRHQITSAEFTRLQTPCAQARLALGYGEKK